MRAFPAIIVPFLAAVLAALCVLTDGREAAAQDVPAPARDWRGFWSFRPIARPVPPAVKDAAWPRNDLDRFILARLEAAGLRPAPPADKATLLRRLSFDLTGLPPTPEEVAAFLADDRPDAHERLVDRLLASPHYGESWGRHWLDVARYVETRISFPYRDDVDGAAAYRDYVVRAFNADKPFDRFVVEQLAGDLLPPGATRGQHLDQAIAPGYLSLGAWFEECTDPNRLRLDMADEMVDAVSRGFLGLTVSCARCHDHKSDPVPIEDYYAFAGVFRSTRLLEDFAEYWRDGRVRLVRPLATPDELAADGAVRREAADTAQARERLLRGAREGLARGYQKDLPAYRAAAAPLGAADVLAWNAADFAGQANLRVANVRHEGGSTEVVVSREPRAGWVQYRITPPGAGKHRLEILWASGEAGELALRLDGRLLDTPVRFLDTGSWGRTHERWDDAATFDLDAAPHTIRLDREKGPFPALAALRLVRLDPGRDQRLAALAKERHLDARLLARLVEGRADPLPTWTAMPDWLGEGDRAGLAALEERLRGLRGRLRAFPGALSVRDEPRPIDLPVHLRGEADRPGDRPTPRGVPGLLAHALPSPAMPQGASGRLEVARWIASPDNPLTPRVLVNRLWHWHFGRGLAATTSDFGSRGEPPTHPELLDHLARAFIDSGFSIKAMHRLIATSSTYRMSGAADVTRGIDPSSIDPGNRLFWRFPVRRLEAEAIYDAMLCAAGKLPRQASGTALQFEKSRDRAMYVLSSRRSPPGLGPEIRKWLALQDQDATGTLVGERQASATPAQALSWLNGAVPLHFAGEFARRLLAIKGLDDTSRAERAHVLALGRPADAATTAQLVAFVNAGVAAGQSPEQAWTRLCQALFASTAFRTLE